MSTNVEKNFVKTAERFRLICNVDFTEEVKNTFLPKFQDDENFKKKIEEAYYWVIKFFEESIKLETIHEETRQLVQAMIEETTIEEYTNEVYEILCRIAILEGEKDNVTSLEQFYEESISMAKTEYIAICMNRINSEK